MKNGTRSYSRGTYSSRTQYPQSPQSADGRSVARTAGRTVDRTAAPDHVDAGVGEHVDAGVGEHVDAGVGERAAEGGEDEETFIALRVSYQLIEALVAVIAILERRNRELANQIERAASSVSLNLGEGQRSLKGNQLRHYALAHGSANEVKVALRVATAWGWLPKNERALAILDRLLALLWKLTRPSSRRGT